MNLSLQISYPYEKVGFRIFKRWEQSVYPGVCMIRVKVEFCGASYMDLEMPA